MLSLSTRPVTWVVINNNTITTPSPSLHNPTFLSATFSSLSKNNNSTVNFVGL